MKILWIGTARQVARVGVSAALCVAGVPGYGGTGGGATPPANTGPPAVAPASSSPGAEGTDGAEAVARNCHCTADTYAIVNLVPGIGYRTRINKLGQAAFEFVSPSDRLRVGFFDGERMSDISPPGSETAQLGDMNAKGALTLYSALPSGDSFNLVPFRWSSARGWARMPVLSTDWDSFTGAINDNGLIVGASGIGPGEAGYRAVRWGATNSLLRLSMPAGFGESIVYGINANNVSVGLAYNDAGKVHAFLWDNAGRPTELGALGATEAFGSVINGRGEIAGSLDFFGPNFQAFLWSPGKGVTRVGLHTIAGELNNVGELVGRIYYPDTGVDHAYVFSRARKLVNLHRGPFTSSDASQADDNGTVVGQMSSNISGPFAQRAYRWSRGGEAVDLNTRLLDVPDGLVVTNALRIASSGDIIATSNAGLILLRRAGGTNAPVLGPIVIPDEVLPEVPVTLKLSFRDRNKSETHIATVDWGDGSGPQLVPISERNGRGELSAVHSFPTAGDFHVVVRVTDSGGRTTTQAHRVTIYPPWVHRIVGEGNLPAIGGRGAQSTLAFRLAAPLTPTDGKALPFTFLLQGRVAFKGEQLERVSRTGNTISLEGSGKLNGQPGYRFRIEAKDGQQGGALEADRLRVLIEHADSGKTGVAQVRRAVLNYGFADSKSAAGPAGREGMLPPTGLRLIE